MNKIVTFSIKLLILLAIVFPIHAYVQNFYGQNYFGNILIGSYLTNYILVVLSFILLIKLQKKYTNSLGFIFMGGSLVKFAVFLVFFNPHYKLDGAIYVAEFSAFFVPYGIGLTIETISLVRLLNRAE
jgi:hypothetical protein